MSEAVVDQFEQVEVDEQDREELVLQTGVSIADSRRSMK
jgi:hypothetical protein